LVFERTWLDLFAVIGYGYLGIFIEIKRENLIQFRHRRVAQLNASQIISRVPRPSFAWAGVFVGSYEFSDWEQGRGSLGLNQFNCPS
jgi:hypothetical protein